MIDKFVQIALSKVGTREEGGNNKGASIIEFQKATWLKPDAWAWCAAFVAWCMLEWINSDSEAEIALNDRCKDASAFGWIKWAEQHRLQVYMEDGTGQPAVLAKRGDIIVFDFSHIGIVTADQLSMHDNIHTVEGNTNGKGERDSVTGDGVWEKVRSPLLTRAYIRLKPIV